MTFHYGPCDFDRDHFYPSLESPVSVSGRGSMEGPSSANQEKGGFSYRTKEEEEGEK